LTTCSHRQDHSPTPEDSGLRRTRSVWSGSR
jgi:hypothetical protein